MSRRASAAAATRRRIVEATRELHSAQGIAATSWDDIAKRAGVGVGTVYRHFPTLDELVPACGEVAMEAVALPDPRHADELFAGITAPDRRIARLVSEVYAIYERGASDLRPVRLEADVHPSLAEAARALEASLDALIDSALEPLAVSAADRRIVRAMLDMGTWQALRDQSVEPSEAASAVSQMVAARIGAINPL
jgi:AcrR family transcriptional regulator